MRSDKSSDDQLMERLRHRDPHAIEQVYLQSFDRCAKVVLGDGGNKEDAKEVFQEAIFSLIIKLKNPEFAIKSNVGAYLRQSCFNIWVHAKRRARKLQVIDAGLIQMTEETSMDEEKSALEEKYERLYACLRKLTDACQRILDLSYYQKKKDKEIALLMDYTPEFVKNKRRRCMQSLRKYMTA